MEMEYFAVWEAEGTHFVAKRSRGGTFCNLERFDARACAYRFAVREIKKAGDGLVTTYLPGEGNRRLLQAKDGQLTKAKRIKNNRSTNPPS